ncbi:alpha/beta hydrolase [Cellulomonas fimi]|uniref:Alpha/beta hydrolase n=1 Tax=Cellulomonas fimi TaxID=1708 RepID=A0A7Y0LY32_CELFI|nr:alpha/beta hydrolase [Cellulomonas fimi]NMR20367.1 alpha/beta hydrolase [Cellulomonas fimi]
MATRWRQDALGPHYQARTLELGTDDEGEVVATVVRYRPPAPEPVRPARAILYVHGWSDYFFQTELAEYWHAQGAAFYAVDLRKYGRSLRPHQTPCYVDDLAEYDADLEAALDVVRRDLGVHARIMIMGHSTGGLVASLWLDRNPGVVSGLVLNSPWLELQGSAVMRHISTPAINQVARFQRKTPLPNIDPGYYHRTISADQGGEWAFDPRWRPSPAFPVRAGWLRAILAGHALVARGLSISVPILALASARSLISPRWSDAMTAADVVLDVEVVVRRAVQLGSGVTVVRIDGGLHDLTLSPRPVRDRFYAEITRWTTAYGWD